MTLKALFRSWWHRLRKKRRESGRPSMESAAEWSSPTIDVRLYMGPSEDAEATMKEVSENYDGLFRRLANKSDRYDGTNRAPPLDDGFDDGTK